MHSITPRREVGTDEVDRDLRLAELSLNGVGSRPRARPARYRACRTTAA